jgi:hypothetical protein
MLCVITLLNATVDWKCKNRNERYWRWLAYDAARPACDTASLHAVFAAGAEPRAGVFRDRPERQDKTQKSSWLGWRRGKSGRRASARPRGDYHQGAFCDRYINHLKPGLILG